MSNATKKPGTEVPFYYAEECGLALMLNRPTGKKICMDKEVWSDIVSSLQAGWQPGARPDGR